jgi:hypothetical protein
MTDRDKTQDGNWIEMEELGPKSLTPKDTEELYYVLQSLLFKYQQEKNPSKKLLLQCHFNSLFFGLMVRQS